MNLLSLYEKLEGLVNKLPESLQSPILREIRPVKALFLNQRPPRLLILGDRAASRSVVLNTLFAAPVAQPTEDHVQDSTWQLFASEGFRVRALDARRPASVASLRRALNAEPPDVCLYLHTEPLREAEAQSDLEHAAEVLHVLSENRGGRKAPIFGVASGIIGGDDAETSRRQLDRLLHRPQPAGLSEWVAGIFSTLVGPAEVERLSIAIAHELPEEARLEWVRMARVKELQLEMAQSLVKSMSAICGAVGTQPIPLADFPILTSLQAAMVAGIMHIAGREMSVRQAGEWLGALGVNIGMGLALREGARAALKLVPVWGDLVAGGVAAAGTYAIGRTATAYFIEGVTLARAKEIFKEKKKKPAEIPDRVAK